MKKMLVRGLIALLVLVIVGLLVAFTNQDQDTSASAPTIIVSDYSLDWSNTVEELPAGIYNTCAGDCVNRNFAEWIRFDEPTNTATVEVHNVTQAQAYAGVNKDGYFFDPLTTNINGDIVTVELPESQTSFLLWIATENNDPFGIVDR